MKHCKLSAATAALLAAVASALVINSTDTSQFVAESTHCPAQCSCTWQAKSVACLDAKDDLNTYVRQLPVWTAHLSVMCSQSAHDPSALRNLRPDAFRSFLDAREISLRNCLITELPDELFAYLPLLSAVILDKLAFATLPSGLFRGSSSLNSLWVIQTPTYLRQTGRPLAGTSVSELRLIGTSLNGEGLLNLIAPIAGRIRVLDVHSGRGAERLRLPRGAFNDTSALETLNLANNALADFTFLDGISATRITLTYNPIDAPGELSFSGLRPNWRPTALELGHTGLRRFPSGLATAFPALQELVLANNAIEELPAEPLMELTKLTRLDLSSNQISRLSIELKPVLVAMLYRDRYTGQVYLANNPLRCNCELAWIFDNAMLHNNLPKDVTCATGGPSGGIPLIQVQRHQLRCSPPTKPIIEVHVASQTDSNALIFLPVGTKTEATDEQSYKLRADFTAQLTCTSSGDPAPILQWLWRGDLLKKSQLASFTSSTQRRVRSQLTMHVDQAQMPLRQMRLTCLARSGAEAGAAGSAINASASVVLVSEVPIVSSTVSPPPLPPPPPKPGTQQSKDNDKSASSQRQLGSNSQYYSLTNLLALLTFILLRFEAF